MSKRLFVAIPIEASVALLKQKQFLENNLSEEHIRWVKAENIHLTLKFLGKTPNERIPEIKRVIQEVAQSFSSFSLSLNRVGVFGSRYNARVIWVGTEENAALLDLQQKLVLGFAGIGFADDRQNFVPHFTLGRVKNILHRDHFKRVMSKLNQGFIQQSEIKGISLFESILTPEGPIYKTIQKVDF